MNIIELLLCTNMSILWRSVFNSIVGPCIDLMYSDYFYIHMVFDLVMDLWKVK
jgi:hypothetical protein